MKNHDELLSALHDRFEKNTNRHKGLEWAEVRAKVEGDTEKLLTPPGASAACFGSEFCRIVGS
ncbi:hypothetical protein A3A67_03000 [Candidatus Peribacteria bacterium RIFCSPLOWO2_01_FULL_51_18]|nr:MAG: hypothetical protein A3C52_00860 [Candidatus Peribacteria bacterium RIFCSPHIGHO2_02_FULL_51_15]OGJ66014.1 MAG: hypothetical protein A3A67_03000 [Candidatus Peribacteria bacterium RIFCSPLOWO2_01_FULL_51_18]OGJ69299.1 MAG: hypothetical protein A3J34_01940 [Candidatus Peribacteria bacterium RIFCSPLOWO2_02_FULL_51_10]